MYSGQDSLNKPSSRALYDRLNEFLVGKGAGSPPHLRLASFQPVDAHPRARLLDQDVRDCGRAPSRSEGDVVQIDGLRGARPADNKKEKRNVPVGVRWQSYS